MPSPAKNFLPTMRTEKGEPRVEDSFDYLRAQPPQSKVAQMAPLWNRYPASQDQDIPDDLEYVRPPMANLTPVFQRAVDLSPDAQEQVLKKDTTGWCEGQPRKAVVAKDLVPA